MLGRAPQLVQLPNSDEFIPADACQAEMASIPGRRGLNDSSRVWGSNEAHIGERFNLPLIKSVQQGDQLQNPNSP